MSDLQQIETLTLTEYIDKEMTQLRKDALDILASQNARNMLLKVMEKNCMLIALQEIAYRIEYGFITEIGNTSLKDHLPNSC